MDGKTMIRQLAQELNLNLSPKTMHQVEGVADAIENQAVANATTTDAAEKTFANYKQATFAGA